MSTGLVVQYVIVGVVALFGVWITFRKLAPRLSSRWLATLALRLDRSGSAAWQRAFARRLQPKQSTGNCSDGCDTCGSCGPKPPAAARDVHPLEFRPRGK
ncbi:MULTISPECIES: DUF6587 family protein [Dyella]|uniref:DUF6587 family protein n=1 Tax=Dyella TaxID=231454 RepID=UPI000C83CF34|nr:MULTISPECIES: DUF6587 family protein [Dyella]MDR3448041.1 hypothetical protein [Dyella sp.]PMQ05494.1 hypothetical protein DyAD56_09195 [Dyella sp. AD56]ULU24720.1 hypothetical protein DYST_01640 [Dyella terrae]